MRRLILVVLLQYLCSQGFTQLSENFNDGDYSANPSWTTSSNSDWTVNSSGQLQSNNTVANSTFYISTNSTMASTAQWEFWLRLAFNTSSANYVDVYLAASASNLTLSSTTGYFVRIGNTQDDICLYRKDANGTATKIIDGVDAITDNSDNVLKIKVVRNAANQFTLLRDITGTGNNYVSEGSVVDATYTASTFFGFLVKQSTSSFFQKHFFDDIEIQTYVPDVTPPSILSVTPLSSTAVDVLFSESVEQTSSQTSLNYVVNNSIGRPSSATRDASNTALVHLTFANAFTNGVTNTIIINGVKDLSGNAISNGTNSFSFYVPQTYDVVIDEVLADPSPQIALPNTEFIELKNVSGRMLNLQGWRIATASAVSSGFPAYNLPADSFLIITSASGAALFTQYGRVLGVGSFPSLPNDGSLLSLTSKEGKTIHAVDYNPGWYQNSIKADGGWTLEMIDTKNPCTGISNWKGSTDISGGTPGRKNAVDAVNNDSEPPQLIRTYSFDSLNIVVVFDEPLDSFSASVIANYSFTNNLTIVSAKPQAPLFTTVVLKLFTPMQKQTIYMLTVNNVKDCKGNTIGAYNKSKTGWAEDAFASDVVINEILFNPRPNAYDYVELYNQSNKIVDGNKMFIANRTSTGALASFQKMSDTPFLIFPGDYVVLTSNPASLKTEYFVANPFNVLTVSLPSYPDDKGTVVITNNAGDVVDEVGYSEKWHFGLIDDPEGVALERIDPNDVSQTATNWHSAASTAGYGTPTARNSQYKQTENITATIAVTPQIFSPDNDGIDDIASISYNVEERGYVANVIIFDASGRMVKQLVKNDLLGLKGRWVWDGLDEKGLKLPIGTYVIYTEIFNLQGRKKGFKNTIVLARKLN